MVDNERPAGRHWLRFCLSAPKVDFLLWSYLDFNQGEPGRLHVTSAGGVLGWGIGAAIGTKIGYPKRQVALLLGDGSFQFGVQALWSAARYEVPVAIFIFNNHAYQANRLALHKYGGRAAQTGKYIGSYLGSPEIDNVKIAHGYGVDGERVQEPQELGEAIDRCLEAVASGRHECLTGYTPRHLNNPSGNSSGRLRKRGCTQKYCSGASRT